jgi:hypothetical protein
VKRLLLSGGPRTIGASLTWSVALTVAAVTLIQPVSAPDRFPPYDHARLSLDLALNLSACGRVALLSTVFAPARHLTEHPDALRLPAAEILSRGAGSVDAYCATLAQPLIHNENGLMIMMAAVWAMNPGLTPADVARVIQWIRIAGVWLFGLACLHAGVGVAMTFALIAGSVAVLKAMTDYHFTVYPFLLIVPLTWTAFCLLIYQPMRLASLPRVCACAVVTGAIGAWNTHVRTSSVPMEVALYSVLLTACLWHRTRARARSSTARFVAAGIGGFIVAWVACNAVITYTFAPIGSATQSNYTHHAIAHQLVIGLGVPSTPLSRSEGISWSDDVGWAIAQRVTPGVGYLGPGYEPALARYYLRLWRTRPRDMVATYWAKLLRTGRGVFLFASDLLPAWRPLRKIYLVWADRANGFEIMLVSVGVTLLSLWALWRTTSPLALLASLLAIAFTLILIESAIIYPDFILAYHSFMMFMVLVAPAVALQAALDAAAAWRRSRGATPARHDIGERA